MQKNATRCLFLCLMMGLWVLAWPAEGQQPSADWALLNAAHRLPLADWDTLAYSDFRRAMADFGQSWPQIDGQLSPAQLVVWEGVWQPDLFSAELEPLGFSPAQIRQAVEARRPGVWILWLEGAIDPQTIGRALIQEAYQPVEGFPAEAYQADPASPWAQIAPYLLLADGQNVFITNERESLAAVLAVYDGLADPLSSQDALLIALSDETRPLSSAVLRFDEGARACAAEESQIIMHGLRYNPQTRDWEYWLSLAYAESAPVGQAQTLAELIEFSTYQVPGYGGVLGQHSALLVSNTWREGPSSRLLQFVLRLKDSPEMPALPFELAQQSDACLLFSAPPANAPALALRFLPDLSGGRTNLVLRFGNTEQALYNAGRDDRLGNPRSELPPPQEVAINSSWRTALAFESDFDNWFGFSSRSIYQTIELNVATGEYTRLIWGDFRQSTVEAALNKTGYVALEQYNGTRLYTLREGPTLLSSLALYVASPADGVLILSNQAVNLRLTLDVWSGRFSSNLQQFPEMRAMMRALGDVSNATLLRYWNGQRAGLVCGLPPYKTEAFANVQRDEGWEFVYAVGFSPPLSAEEAEVHRLTLARALEASDYPLRGPGSQTFGEASELVTSWTVEDAGASILLVAFRLDLNEQEASFFGQEIATASLSPCALGDTAE